MTAVYQARIAIMFGGGLLLIGTVKALLGSASGAAPFLSAGAVIAFFGGALRLWMRRKWLAAMASGSESTSISRERLMSGPMGRFWAFWLGVSSDGARSD